MQIISRADWGARPPVYRRAIPLPSPELWLHHSVSASGGASRIRGIQNFHMDERGWPDIAYTFLINHEGLIFEGVPPGLRGTHTANHNVSGHAVCLLGNFNTTQPSQPAVDALVGLVRHGHGEGWWPLGFTGGHRDTRGSKPGDCPGDNLYAQLPEINRLIQEDDMTPDEVRLLALEPIIQALQRQSVAWYRALQTATGTPGGNADYWGADFKPPAGQSKPTLGEWQSNAVTIHAAALRVGMAAAGTVDATARAAAAGAKARADTAHDRLDKAKAAL